MAMCRLTNAEFHKFLNDFAEEVAKGHYRKMPYDKYRTFRNWHDTSVDIVLESYCNLNGDIVTRIRVSPDSPTGYEFYIDDGSFGNFCSDYLRKKKEEPKVHPDEKRIQYDIFGNATYNSYADCTDSTLRQALHDYYVDKAITNTTGASKSISSAQTDGTVTIAGYPISGTGIGVMSADNSEVRMTIDVMKDDIDALGERIHDVNAKCSSTCDAIEKTAFTAQDMAYGAQDIAYKAQEMVYQLADKVEDLASMMAEKADVEALRYIDIEAETKIAELAYKVDKLTSLETQSTNSNVYPVKNYNIDIKADYMSGSDNRKEKENMDTSKMFNFDFGPVSSAIRMSPYGMAMKNADGKYVSYDKNSGNIMDVEIFNFDAQKFLYKMPVAVNAVAVGDIVVHMRKAMFVSAVNGNRISVIDIYNGEVKDIMPTTSPFGFNFITKVVSLIDMSGANTDSPFGNMLPFLLMGDNKDNNSMAMMAVAMSMNGGMNANMMSNPLMLMAMMDGKADIGMLMYLAMQNQMTNANTNCVCHCHDGENHQ